MNITLTADDWIIVAALMSLAFILGVEVGGRLTIFRYMTQGIQDIRRIEDRSSNR